MFLAQDFSLVEFPQLRPVVEAGLNAEDHHTRAIALCFLNQDPGLFDRMMTQSSVDPAKVDAEIAAFRNR